MHDSLSLADIFYVVNFYLVATIQILGLFWYRTRASVHCHTSNGFEDVNTNYFEIAKNVYRTLFLLELIYFTDH